MPDNLARDTVSTPMAPMAPRTCLNCGTALSGAFCTACGQRDIPPYPSLRELVTDAISEFSGWDGRLAATLRTLVRHPGALTRDFLEGRRARYISPLRLYLTASIVYFLLAAATVRMEPASNMPGGFRISTSDARDDGRGSRPQRVATAAGGAMGGTAVLTAAERDSVLADIAGAPALLQPIMRRVILDAEGFKRGLLQTMPKMLFALLPLFALIVAVFYRQRKYPEHLYFALHLHTFVFLALGVTQVVELMGVEAFSTIAGVMAVIAIPIYATRAFRTVYGGSIAGTVAKEAAIAFTYLLVTGFAFLVTVYWVSVMT